MYGRYQPIFDSPGARQGNNLGASSNSASNSDILRIIDYRISRFCYINFVEPKKHDVLHNLDALFSLFREHAVREEEMVKSRAESHNQYRASQYTANTVQRDFVAAPQIQTGSQHYRGTNRQDPSFSTIEQTLARQMERISQIRNYQRWQAIHRDAASRNLPRGREYEASTRAVQHDYDGYNANLGMAAYTITTYQSTEAGNDAAVVYECNSPNAASNLFEKEPSSDRIYSEAISQLTVPVFSQLLNTQQRFPEAVLTDADLLNDGIAPTPQLFENGALDNDPHEAAAASAQSEREYRLMARLEEAEQAFSQLASRFLALSDYFASSEAYNAELAELLHVSAIRTESAALEAGMCEVYYKQQLTGLHRYAQELCAHNASLSQQYGQNVQRLDEENYCLTQRIQSLSEHVRELEPLQKTVALQEATIARLKTQLADSERCTMTLYARIAEYERLPAAADNAQTDPRYERLLYLAGQLLERECTCAEPLDAVRASLGELEQQQTATLAGICAVKQKLAALTSAAFAAIQRPSASDDKYDFLSRCDEFSQLLSGIARHSELLDCQITALQTADLATAALSCQLSVQDAESDARDGLRGHLEGCCARARSSDPADAPSQRVFVALSAALQQLAEHADAGEEAFASLHARCRSMLAEVEVGLQAGKAQE